MPRYEFMQGRARWFWDINLEGKSFTIGYGKVGTTEQPTRQSYASGAVAKKEYDRVIASLHQKGYAPLEGDKLAKAVARHAKGAAKQVQAVAKGPKPSRFAVPLAVLRDRLFASDIPAKRWGLSKALEFARILESEPNALGLWIDEPWDKLSPKDFRTPPNDVVAAVFTKPVQTQRSLVLRDQDLFGFRGDRDGFTFVFLDAVRARDLCQVPDALAIFARGLTVARLASFDGGDCSTTIAGHLKAPYVLSGVGGGWANIEPKTVVEVGAYASYIRGLPKGTKALKHRSLEAMLPFLAEEAASS